MSQGKAVTQEKIQGEFSLSQGEFPGKNPGTEERREGDSLSSLDLRIEDGFEIAQLEFHYLH